MTRSSVAILGRAALASAARALRDYRRAAVALALAGALALGAVWPVAALGDISSGGVGLRLQAAPLPGREPTLDAAARSVAATRQGAVDTLSMMLLALAAGTLAVGLVTVVALSATRESERAAELAVRRAVGASRRALVASALVEAGTLAAAVVAVAGLAGGLVLGRAAASWSGGVAPHGPALVALAVVAIVMAIAAGALVPVLLPRRRVAALDPSEPTPLAPAAIQLGLSLVALAGGTLVAREARELAAPRAAGEGLVATVTPAETGTAARAERYRRLLDALAGVPGAASASLTAPGTLLGLGPVSEVTTECGYCSEGTVFVPWRVKPATYQFLSADTFRLIGTGVVAGRGITEADRWDAPRVAVVSRSLAAREFQDGEAIGRRIKVAGSGWSTVVGVVDDPRPTGLGGGAQPRYAVYLSVLQYPPPSVDVLVRAPPGTDTPRAAGAAIAETLGASVGPVAWRRESAVRAAEARPLRWFGRWLAWEGWAMLLVATLGAAAQMHLWVRSLAAELGVRRAVGARRRQVIGLVLRRALGVAAAGVLIALWFGPPVWGILPTMLTGAAGWEAGTVARFAAVLGAAVFAAALVPARRAARESIVELIGAGGT